MVAGDDSVTPLHSAVVFGSALILGLLCFWLGRVSRDNEVRGLKGQRDAARAEAGNASDRARRSEEGLTHWIQALAAQQLAAKPKRSKDGRFAKR